MNSKIDITCPSHGLFKQRISAHRNGSGCPKCRESKGENKITKYLNDRNYEFSTQKTFKDCKNIRALRFDFYIKKQNLAIEFNGSQHYKPVKFFGGVEKFKQGLINDKIKFDYCESVGMRLLILTYKDINNIESILDTELY